MSRPPTAAARVAAALALALAAGCAREPASEAAAPAADPPGPAGRGTSCVLLPLAAGVDPERGGEWRTHLALLVPGERPARVSLAFHFVDRDPARAELVARPRATTEQDSTRWPLGAGGPFAIVATSERPVVCQATVGWTPATGAPREAARSTLPARPGRRLLHADGWRTAAGDPGLRELEWLAVLDPGGRARRAELRLLAPGGERSAALDLPAGRLLLAPLEPLAPERVHYGAELIADAPVAAAWLREVRGPGSEEPMALWSVPLQPAPAGRAKPAS